MGTTREQAKNRIAEEDLRAVTGPAELTRLWVKLGFDEAGLDVPPEAWSAWGIRESDALALGRLSIVAARGAFRVLLFELLTPAGSNW